MRILIDNQYKLIYNGEFKNWVERCVIEPLSEHNSIDFAKNFDEMQMLLPTNNYDLAIATGYDASVLGAIDSKKCQTKIACIIYDMNAEQVLSFVEDNGMLSDVVAFKSRLIFLSNYILCYSKEIKQQILELYSPYKHTVDVEPKLKVVEYSYKPKKYEKRRLIQRKYALIKESVNGLTFSSQDLHNFISNIISSKDALPSNFAFVVTCTKFPEKIWNMAKEAGIQDKFIILNDVSEEEMRQLESYAIATIFASPICNNLDSLCDAICSESLCIINSANQVMNGFLEDSALSLPFGKECSIAEEIMQIMRAGVSERNDLWKLQRSLVDYKSAKAKALKLEIA